MTTFSTTSLDNTSFSYALVTACNVLMNLVVLEPQLIQSKESAADRTLKFIVKNLPNLTNAGELPSSILGRETKPRARLRDFAKG